MIKLTRFNGRSFYLNAELIVSVEATPDTVITLLDHSKVLVKDTPEEVVDNVIQYQQSVKNPKLATASGE